MKIGGGFGVDVSGGDCAEVDGCGGSMGRIEKGLAVVKDGGLVGEGGVVFLDGRVGCLPQAWSVSSFAS
jgi:hypothetical protein